MLNETDGCERARVVDARMAPLSAIITVVNRRDQEKVAKLLHEEHSLYQITCLAQGTLGSEWLDLLGFGSVDKTINLCVAPSASVESLMARLSKTMKLAKAGKGIAFSISLTGIGAAAGQLIRTLARDPGPDTDVWSAAEADITAFSGKEARKMIATNAERAETADAANYWESIGSRFDSTHFLIVAVVNRGNSEELSEVARSVGARGGTVVHALRTGLDKDRRLFGRLIQPEKEIVLILARSDIKRELVETLTRSFGLRTEAGGIIFTMPVESVSGLT